MSDSEIAFPAAGSEALLDGIRVTTVHENRDGSWYVEGRGLARHVAPDELLPIGADLEREPDGDFLDAEAMRRGMLGKAA